MTQPKHPYERLADELVDQIESGRLRPGDQLPSRRELCVKHGVSDQVVGGAMRVLRSKGLIVTLLGSGVFVADRPEAASSSGQLDAADDEEPEPVAV